MTADVVPGIRRVQSPSLEVTSPKYSNQQWCHSFLHFPYLLFRLWYFSSFTCSFFLMLLSLEIATFRDDVCFRIHCHFTTLNLESHRIVAQSLSTTFGGVFYFNPGPPSPYFVQMFLFTLTTICFNACCMLRSCVGLQYFKYGRCSN